MEAGGLVPLRHVWSQTEVSCLQARVVQLEEEVVVTRETMAARQEVNTACQVHMASLCAPRCVHQCVAMLLTQCFLICIMVLVKGKEMGYVSKGGTHLLKILSGNPKRTTLILRASFLQPLR